MCSALEATSPTPPKAHTLGATIRMSTAQRLEQWRASQRGTKGYRIFSRGGRGGILPSFFLTVKATIGCATAALAVKWHSENPPKYRRECCLPRSLARTRPSHTLAHAQHCSEPPQCRIAMAGATMCHGLRLGEFAKQFARKKPHKAGIDIGFLYAPVRARQYDTAGQCTAIALLLRCCRYNGPPKANNPKATKLHWQAGKAFPIRDGVIRVE